MSLLMNEEFIAFLTRYEVANDNMREAIRYCVQARSNRRKNNKESDNPFRMRELQSADALRAAYKYKVEYVTLKEHMERLEIAA